MIIQEEKRKKTENYLHIFNLSIKKTFQKKRAEKEKKKQKASFQLRVKHLIFLKEIKN